MTKREFALLIYRVLGIYCIINSFSGSQFFITEVPTDYLDHHYTIFGQCDDPGILVVKSIARVERDGNDKPLQPVTLNKVTIVRQGGQIPPPPQPAAATPGPSTSQP